MNVRGTDPVASPQSDVSRGHSEPGREPPARRRFGGVESNARLTASTGVVLLVLLAAEGLTVLSVRSLLTPHVFIGMVLVPPLLLKMSSTLWRFVRYYRGSPEYRRKGPPPTWLRLLGPVLVVLTLAVFASGIVLLVGPKGWRVQFLFFHKASFVLWLGAFGLHLLGHVLDTARLAPRDWMARTRHQIRGASLRQWTIAASVALGMLLAALVVPQVGPWLVSGGAGGA